MEFIVLKKSHYHWYHKKEFYNSIGRISDYFFIIFKMDNICQTFQVFIEFFMRFRIQVLHPYYMRLLQVNLIDLLIEQVNYKRTEGFTTNRK